MNCREFEGIVLSLARDENASPPGEEHAQGCARCRARLAEEQALWLAVRATSDDIASEAAPARVEAALLAAFRARAAQPVQRDSPPASRRLRARPLWIGAALAASILLLSLVRAAWSRFEPRTTETGITLLPTPQSGLSNLPSVAKGGLIASSPKNIARPVRRSTVRKRNQSEGKAAATFYALAGMENLVPLESGRVVRVEVPAATLIPYGIPVEAEMMAVPVQADLLLGQDGLARAIRFLPPAQNNKVQ